MSMPGFTAEASSYRSSSKYVMASTGAVVQVKSVVPAQFGESFSVCGRCYPLGTSFAGRRLCTDYVCGYYFNGIIRMPFCLPVGTYSVPCSEGAPPWPLPQ
jgi:hypothetical protein